MRNPLKIGERTFKYKKDALAFYRSILNAYNFGKSLSDEDFDSVLDLLFYDTDTNEDEKEQNLNDKQQLEFKYDTDEDEDYLPLDDGQKADLRYETFGKPLKQIEDASDNIDIVDIKVSRVQFNTKCFEVFYSDLTSQYISYILLINKPKHNPHGTFNIACRSTIQSDLIQVKQLYFKTHAVNGFVKCQETGQLSKWGDLAVDHRQPNTFSVIVDRFKEVFQIDPTSVDYEVNELNVMLFKDETLVNNFKNYHKEKANLRIVRKENNLSRTGMARVKRTSKDLIIK
jgi:hypothetical protein